MNLPVKAKEIGAFLERLHPGGPSTVMVFEPKVVGKTLDNESATDWACERDSASNIYVLIGLAEGSPTTTPTKEKMRGSNWLWCDVDPRARENLEDERERIRSLLTDRLPAEVPPPTLIIDSGRGYWALWQLDQPCHDTVRIESSNLWLANCLHGDKCHNINKVMRLAGTLNLKTGQRSRILSINANNIYSIDEFSQVDLSATLPLSSGDATAGGMGISISPIKTESLEGLGVPDRLKVIIAQGRHPDEPAKKDDDSRSAWLFDVCCNLIRADIPDEVIFGVITDPRWKISESVLDKGRDAKSYAIRQIASAHEMIAKDERPFQLGQTGKLLNNQFNTRLALHKLGVRLSYDEFADRLVIHGLPGHGPVLQDSTVAELWLQVDERFEMPVPKERFWTIVENEARRNPYHPVRDYLNELVWDGKSRIDPWLITYSGAEDTPYVRAVGSLPLIAAVRRARHPGCKFDEMLVLLSKQGTGKSTALSTLCPNPDWFTDDCPLNVDTKIVIERLNGRWIVEAAELNGMRRGQVEHIKSFLSRQIDRARMAYGRITQERRRQSILIGTTNSDRFLRDSTGDRRFWPVAVGRFDLKALAHDRDQLWAEAAYREAAGESIRLNPELYPTAAEAQEDHRIEDPFIGRLTEILGDLSGKLKSEDAWEIIGVPPGQRTQEHNKRLGESMRELGWERKKLRHRGSSPQWTYVRGEGNLYWIEVSQEEMGRISARPDVPGAPF